jgi:hypothetical protein
MGEMVVKNPDGSISPYNEAASQSVAEYAPGVRQAVGASSTEAIALPALGPSRRVRVMANTRCWLRFGTSGVGAAAADGNSIPFAPDAPEVVVVPASATHWRVIRDNVDGFVTLTPTVR